MSVILRSVGFGAIALVLGWATLQFLSAIDARWIGDHASVAYAWSYVAVDRFALALSGTLFAVGIALIMAGRRLALSAATISLAILVAVAVPWLNYKHAVRVCLSDGGVWSDSHHACAVVVKT